MQSTSVLDFWNHVGRGFTHVLQKLQFIALFVRRIPKYCVIISLEAALYFRFELGCFVHAKYKYIN